MNMRVELCGAANPGREPAFQPAQPRGARLGPAESGSAGRIARPTVILLGVLLLTGAAWAQPPVRIVLTGDSTVNDGGGWGPGLRSFFTPQVEVTNLARNGRSSKSFRDEGAWAPALDARANYILIQFGHNDGPGKGPERETDPKTTYRENMARYVDEARAAGAEPVLVTSIVRRVFTAEGKIKRDSLAPYVEE